jgi:diketogulonate reductase-like aldo/keto reductase
MNSKAVSRVLEDEFLLRITAKVQWPNANIALRFLLLLGPVAVLPERINTERILTSAQLDFALTENQIVRLKGREHFFRIFNLREEMDYDGRGDDW